MAKRKKGEQYIFIVEGSGRFPFDMLRYEQCWPCSEAHDTPAIAAHPMEGDTANKLRRVALVTATERGPVEGRWKSFGWRLVAVDVKPWTVDTHRSTPEELQGILRS